MISLLEIAQSINEAEVDDDKIIKYKDKDRESAKMKAGSAKTMEKDHPAKLAWDKMQNDGGDDKKDSGGKLGGSDFDRDGGEKPKAEPKAEPKDEPKTKNKFGVSDDQYIGQTDGPFNKQDVTVKQALAYDGDNSTMNFYKRKAQGLMDDGDFEAYGIDPNHPKGGSPNAKADEPKDEPKGDEEPKKLSSDEIDKKVDDLGKEIFSIYHTGMSDQDKERYIDGLQKQIDDLKSQKESIKVINGKKYKAVKEDRADGKKIVGYRFAGKTYKNKADAPVADPRPVYESKESKKHPLKETYDRTFRSLK